MYSVVVRKCRTFPFRRHPQPAPLPWHRKQQRDTSFGVILQSSTTNRYALVQGRRTGKWSFPKGHRKPEESGWDCAKREAIEETGTGPQQEEPLATTLAVGTYFPWTVRDEFALVPQDTVEIMATGWFSLKEMTSMQLNVDLSTYVKQHQRQCPDRF